MKTKLELEKLQDKGITLIALVITIIVLLILAGVTIATLTGENGILTRASEASEQTKQASSEEQVQLAIAGSIGTDGKININDLNDELANIEGVTYNGKPISTNKIEKLPATVKVNEYKVGILGNGETVPIVNIRDIQNVVYVSEKTIVQDVNGNNLVLPEGFTIRVDESTTNADSVDEGIVIEDQEENQYVWIPIDGILGEDGTIEDVVGSEKKVLLGRYDFASDGTPSEYSGEYIEETQEEHAESGAGNTIANDINGFIESVRNNGGYYFARYEAGDVNATANRTSSSPDDNPLVVKSGQYAYIYVTQLQASELCQNLYSGVNSDLVNSYAWDTAILFIQNYSGDKDYSRQTRLKSGELERTGETLNGEENDIRCNIYDMAVNCMEWTTETYPGIWPCVYRASSYSWDGGLYTSYRNTINATIRYDSDNHSFRPILYIK